MNNPMAELFFKKQEAHRDLLTSIQERIDSFKNQIEKRKDGFSKALEKYVFSSEVDSEYLKLNEYQLNSLGNENVQPSNGANNKKNANNTNNGDILHGASIKKEKLSEGYQSTTSSTSICSIASTADLKDNIKLEKEEMPAPLYIPPKRKVKGVKTEQTSRVTRTKGKKVKSASNPRDSDLVFQEPAIPVIHLSDPEESDSGNAEKRETTTRSTRTKAKKTKAEKPVESEAETDNDSIKESRDQDKTEDNVNTMGTRSTRTKTIRKGKKAEEEDIQPETRSTRTKTIKKAPKEVESIASSKDSNNIDEANKQTVEVEQAPRSTRTKTMKKAVNQNTIDSTDTNVVEVTRSTRTKTRKGAEKDLSNIHSGVTNGHTKRLRSQSMDNEIEEHDPKKRSKSKSPGKDEGNTTTQTVYEDAQLSLGTAKTDEQILNATYVTENQKIPSLNATALTSQTANANSTVVVEKPKFNIFNKELTPSGFLTDDDSREIKTPPKKKPIKTGKEVFSPYEKTTLKKKVEAFEKLQATSDIPVKSAATLKTNTPSVKEKAKLFTPSGSKFMPSSSSTSKMSRLISHQSSVNNESLLAMKSAQKDSRDKQRRLLDREQALKKKEAMLQAQAEAKRKLNEEKQLKAQQQRKALEAEKQKQLELQKQKEERLKQRELEREDYLMKQKLEAEKKRLAQKKKIQDLQAQREQILAEQNRNPPIYMTTRPPKLPTEDCYDSDDPSYRTVKPPSWCSDDHSRIMQLAMLAAGDKIKNSLFCRHAQTPDLKEIFEVIDPLKLKRSSSILWKKPPRYTMMPNLNDTKFSEDDELYDSD